MLSETYISHYTKGPSIVYYYCLSMLPLKMSPGILVPFYFFDSLIYINFFFCKTKNLNKNKELLLLTKHNMKEPIAHYH